MCYKFISIWKKCQVKHYSIAECLYEGWTEYKCIQSTHKLHFDLPPTPRPQVLGDFPLLYHITKNLLLVSVGTNQSKQVTDVLNCAG